MAKCLILQNLEVEGSLGMERDPGWGLNQCLAHQDQRRVPLLSKEPGNWWGEGEQGTESPVGPRRPVSGWGLGNGRGVNGDTHGA